MIAHSTEKEPLTRILDSLPDDVTSYTQKMSSFLRISSNGDESTKNMKN